MIIKNSLNKLLSEKSHKCNIFFNINTVSLTGTLIDTIKSFEKETGAIIDEPESNKEISLHRISIPGFNNINSDIIINGFLLSNMTYKNSIEVIEQIKNGNDITTIIKNFKGIALIDFLAELSSPILNKADQKDTTISNIEKAINLSPEKVLTLIKDSGLIERGKTLIPVAEKWKLLRKKSSGKGYILFYTDEGIPGVYSDAWNILQNIRTILEGMVISGYATGTNEGVFFLRNEYFYMNEYIENVISEMKERGFLGKDICGNKNFNFDISIRKGVGAYITGGETALIVSTEGKKDNFSSRNLYSAEDNYLGAPAISHSSLTFCSVANIIEKGSNWFNSTGTDRSKGSRNIYISGDCGKSGSYNINYGTSIHDIISLTESSNIEAVILGGPSGEIISENNFSKTISFEENSAVCDIVLINSKKRIPEIALNFMNFFEFESCGWCVPCRTGTTQLKKKFNKILSKKGIEKDIKELQEWSKIITKTSRCGLGKRCPMPVITSLQNFPLLFKEMLVKDSDFVSEFDINAAVKDSFIKDK